MANQPSGRPGADEHAPYYAKYISLVEGEDILAVLHRTPPPVVALLSGMSEEKADYRYAPGKWSVKEVLGHLADAERIFAYRALRISRRDQTPLPGFEQDGYVAAGGFGQRSLARLLAEFSTVREATLALLESLDPEAWTRTGVASNHPVSVRAVAYMTAGHELHHAAILRERYL